jgi:hypothetical protein
MDLERYGFVQAGRWKLYDRVGSGITFELERLADRRVVYAFVVDDEVKYIGGCEKDTTTLRERMKRYKSRQGREHSTPGGENTNQHNARLIREHLEAGKPVLILALDPRPDCKYLDLTVDLVKGLENPLIARFKPEWNR